MIETLVKMLQLIRRMREAREAAAKELAENPEDSSSGKPFKKLYKLGDKVGAKLANPSWWKESFANLSL